MARKRTRGRCLCVSSTLYSSYIVHFTASGLSWFFPTIVGFSTLYLVYCHCSPFCTSRFWYLLPTIRLWPNDLGDPFLIKYAFGGADHFDPEEVMKVPQILHVERCHKLELPGCGACGENLLQIFPRTLRRLRIPNISKVVRPHTTQINIIPCSPIAPTPGSLCVSVRVPRH